MLSHLENASVSAHVEIAETLEELRNTPLDKKWGGGYLHYYQLITRRQ